MILQELTASPSPSYQTAAESPTLELKEEGTEEEKAEKAEDEADAEQATPDQVDLVEAGEVEKWEQGGLLE